MARARLSPGRRGGAVRRTYRRTTEPTGRLELPTGGLRMRSLRCSTVSGGVFLRKALPQRVPLRRLCLGVVVKVVVSEWSPGNARNMVHSDRERCAERAKALQHLNTSMNQTMNLSRIRLSPLGPTQATGTHAGVAHEHDALHLWFVDNPKRPVRGLQPTPDVSAGDSAGRARARYSSAREHGCPGGSQRGALTSLIASMFLAARFEGRFGGRLSPAKPLNSCALS